MGNTFSFFGEVFHRDGGRSGRSGKVITFTGGFDTSPGWGASTAQTLEEITSHKVLFMIRNTGKLVLALPLGLKLGNNFRFKSGDQIPRFTINIMEAGRKVKSIFFQEMKVERIVPRPRQNLVLNGVEHRFETLSMEMVFVTVDRNSISVSG